MTTNRQDSPRPFDIVAGDPGSSWILHVPHASTRVPLAVRARIVLGDDELRAELTAMTDAHTDLLARRIGERVVSGRRGRSSTACHGWSSTRSASSTSAR
jgi:hypothetical protein